MTSPGRSMEPDATVASATVTGILAAADLRRGEIVAGRYRIERLLGMGGMGVVYLARDIELDIDIALKLLRPELASRPDAFERFRQELLLARQVSSPHVVRIHDLVRHGAAWLISMDYVAGSSLERVLDNEGPLAPDRAIRIARQLALGLSAAHHRGVVHRDLKPANVLVNEQGDASITDFGVARSAGNTGITGSGVIIGTPEYLSPEQARADPLDGRSDLYALGLILYEMLSGTLPFRGGTPAEMLAQRIVRDPPPVDSVKPGLPSFAVRLCTRLLELKPARRFQTADDVVRAIDHRRVPGLPHARRRGFALAAGIAMALLAVGAGWRYWPAPAPTAANPTAAVAPVAPLALAPLPLTTASKKPADLELASGIGQRLADTLATTADFGSADPLRVARALTELGYDAPTAMRHRARVAEALGARDLLEGELIHTDQGLVVKLAVVAPDSGQARWTGETPVSSVQTLPAALQVLQQALQTRLDAGAPRAEAWPATQALEAIGTRQHSAPAASDLQASLDVARQSGDPLVWWSLLQSLDHAGRTADVTSVARQAQENLAKASTADARRTQAYAEVLLGDSEGALKQMEPWVKTVTTDHPARLLLARAYGDLGQFDEADKTLHALVAEDPRNADAWYALGKNAIQAGDSKRAVDDYLVHAQVLANRLDDDRLKADIVHALGLGYRSLGQLPIAAEQFENAARLRAARGDLRGQAVSLRNLSSVRSVQGDFKSAQSLLDSAKAILEPLGDVGAMADVLNDTGVLYEERGDYRRSLDAYRSALNLYQSRNDLHQVGNALINVGFTYYQVGEFDNAEVYWKQAAATYAKIEDKSGAVNARLSLGLAQTARGDFTAARESLEGSLREAEESQLAEARVIGLANLAELDRLEGRIERASQHAAEALALFTTRDDPRGSTEMKLLRSAIFADVGDWDNAGHALDGLDAESVANEEQAGLLALRKGEVAYGRGDARTATALADEAIAGARKAHSLGTELSSRLLRSRALAAFGKPADAAREMASVHEGVARYASVPLRLSLAETELRVAPQKGVAVYREARALLARLPDYGRAFEIHALGADASARTAGGEAAEARRAAGTAYSTLRAATPEAGHAALAVLAASMGIPVDTAR
ncbi:MAG: protein kinase [Dokdonella sp.]|uniref:protein kinase domain-containing protein n=1 Tax=Dokdonella sp. TaxID=2291710 RepID=UPI0032676DB2